jgi:hypothetical protein
MEISPDALAGITTLAPLTGNPQGGTIAAMKSAFNIPDAPAQSFQDILKPTPTASPAKPGMA